MALITFVPLFILVGLTSSAPIYPVPLAYVALSPIPENIYNQVQDTRSGEYAFGYAGGPVAREEARTSDGVTRGAYSYVDAHGIVQYYRYIADDDGFRVVGTNIPTDLASSPQLELEAVKIESVDTEDLPEETKEAASSRKKRSAIYGEVAVVNALSGTPLTVLGAASVPTATSSQSRFQIHSGLKTEIYDPIEAIPVETVAAVPSAPAAVPVVAKSIEAVPIAVATSVPTATSSQSRFQIHNSLKTEIHDPIEAIPVETVAVVPAAPAAVPVAVKSIEPVPVAVKSIEAVPVAVAASVPTATSSQSRFQIHNSLKTEIHDPIEAIPIETVAIVAAAPAAVPIAVKSIEAVPVAVASVPAAPASVPAAVKSIEPVPVAVAVSVPTATSSQSRFQIHNSLKTEIHDPIEAIPVETVAAVPAAPAAVPAAVKSIEAVPVAVAASVPTATSSQSRFQIHNSLKTEIHDPIEAIPVETVAVVPAAPASVPVAVKSIEPVPVAVAASVPTVAASVPISTSTQHRFQIHSGLKTEIHEPLVAIPIPSDTEILHHAPFVVAIPADARMFAAIPAAGPTSVAASTSNQHRFQIHSGAKVELQAQPQSLEYKDTNLQPVISLQPSSSFSHPSLARHQVGVGLGLLPSPILAYHNYETVLFAEA